jgi:hypothetical protein
MNEQILKIAKQAGLTLSMDQQVAFQRAAELIVRDCASLCEIQSRSYTYSFTPAKARLAESTAKNCGTIIKRHFGVE